MVFFDYLLLELVLTLSIFTFTYIFNLTTLLFISGVYLIISGVLCLLKDLDVLIGFLWVIDLGVGLIFFIFILHFNSFTAQKSVFSSSSKQFLNLFAMLFFFFLFFYYFSRNTDSQINSDLNKLWILNVTHLNFYTVLLNHEANVLLMLKYVYFSFNSFEFFLINYSLFFGLVCSILSCFLLKRFYSKLLFSQIIDNRSLENINSSFFIRNQNISHQQNIHHSTRIWSKTKNK